MSEVQVKDLSSGEIPSRSNARHRRSWKVPIALWFFVALAAVLFLGLSRDGDSTLRFASPNDIVQLPSITIATRTAGFVVTAILTIIAVGSLVLRKASRNVPVWGLALFGVVFLAGFLIWASAGQTLPIPGLLVGTVALSVPLIFGALGGTITERSGVVNVAIEGQLLAGAFASAVTSTVTGSSALGLLGAVGAGVLVSLVLAVFSIKFGADQVVVGIVLNVLVLGLTDFFYKQVLANNPSSFNNPKPFQSIAIPLLSRVPVIGPTLFNQSIIVYVMYLAVGVVTYALFKTRWGLRTRAIGEHPLAADTVGIAVNRLRYRNVMVAGAIVGFGGAYFTLGSVGAFNEDMTAGAGYIALAAVIFGKWSPIRATLAALLFGFASNLQTVLGIIGAPVPSEFLLMLPYLITVGAVAGFVGVSKPPTASGKPYIKL